MHCALLAKDTGGGGGGYSNFSSYVGSGPVSTTPKGAKDRVLILY